MGFLFWFALRSPENTVKRAKGRNLSCLVTTAAFLVTGTAVLGALSSVAYKTLCPLAPLAVGACEIGLGHVD